MTQNAAHSNVGGVLVYTPTMSRESTYTDELAAIICARIADGESLRKICLDDNMPGRRTVLDWLDDDRYASFRTKYVRAREAQADFYADEILEIADNTEMGITTKQKPSGMEITEGDMIEHRKLKIFARQWYASKLMPKKYGATKDSDGESSDVIIHGGMPI